MEWSMSLIPILDDGEDGLRVWPDLFFGPGRFE